MFHSINSICLSACFSSVSNFFSQLQCSYLSFCVSNALNIVQLFLLHLQDVALRAINQFYPKVDKVAAVFPASFDSFLETCFMGFNHKSLAKIYNLPFMLFEPGISFSLESSLIGFCILFFNSLAIFSRFFVHLVFLFSRQFNLSLFDHLELNN